MANAEHLAILKQGVTAWNQWRAKHPDVLPNLSGANLSGANLSGADLRGADLTWADLSLANLREADLRGANLQPADLGRADLRGANLVLANLTGVHLSGADVSRARFDFTVLGDNDLSQTKGLDTAVHEGPSTIGIDTIQRSGGKIPEAFLRGAGVPDNWIEYMGPLAGQPPQFHSCFISYSTKDQEFADRLHADLQAKGVRCWFASEDLKIGDRFDLRINESIRFHDKLLIVFSRHSIKSDWVETEVKAALERERREKRLVLFPIRLDNTVITTNRLWAARVGKKRHIGDFTNWKDHDPYQKAFDRLLRDLKAEGAAAAPAP